MAKEESQAAESQDSEKKKLVDPKYFEKYGKEKNNGDQVAVALAAHVTEGGKIDQDKLWDVAKTNGIDMDRYAHLNIGMQRMNVGNRLRGMVNKGIDVKIGKTKIAGVEKETKKAA